VLHSVKAHVTPQATIAEVFLVHSTIPLSGYYGAQSLVTWSLSCEAIFYALLPLILVKLWKASDRAIKWVVAGCFAWLVVLPLITVTFIHSEQVRRGIELNPIFCGAHFMLGVCVGIAFRRGWRPRWNPNLVLLGLLVSFVLACFALRLIVFGDWSHLFGAQPVANAAARAHLAWLVRTRLQLARFAAHLIFAPAALATVIALASADLRGAKSFVSGRCTVKLGDWSYSIYLSHAIVIGYAWSYWHRWHITGPGYQLLLVFSASIIVAGLLHYVVEKPASTALRNFFLRRDKATATPA
jgi:peptidoglycan/LPS O-acetylase OafA/YrhL